MYLLKSPINQNLIIIISNSIVILKDISYLRGLKENFNISYIITRLNLGFEKCKMETCFNGGHILKKCYM
jgi:hypothetical protein